MIVSSDGFTDNSGTIRYMDTITYNFNIEINYSCPVKELSDQTGTILPSYNIFYGLPLSEEIIVPKLEPIPTCGLSSDDVEYQLLDENG